MVVMVNWSCGGSRLGWIGKLFAKEALLRVPKLDVGRGSGWLGRRREHICVMVAVGRGGRGR